MIQAYAVSQRVVPAFQVIWVVSIWAGYGDDRMG